MNSKPVARHLVEVFSGVTCLTAIMLAATPFAFDYPRSSGRAALDLAIGGIVASLAAARVLGSYDARTICGVNILLGIFTLITPWLMLDTHIPEFFLSHMICGTVFIIFSGLSMVVSQVFRPIETHPWLNP